MRVVFVCLSVCLSVCLLVRFDLILQSLSVHKKQRYVLQTVKSIYLAGRTRSNIRSAYIALV